MNSTRLGSTVFLSLSPFFLAVSLVLAGCTTDRSTPTGVDSTSLEDPSTGAEAAVTQELRSTYGTLGATTSTSKGATVAMGFACSVGPAGITFDSRSTLSKGRETLYCRGNLTIGTEPKNTIIITGDRCFLPLSEQYTNRSRLVIGTSGRVELTCRSW